MTGPAGSGLDPADRGRARQYPQRPIVGVGGVIIVERRRILLARRRYEPLAGQWSLPGGALELGETLHEAVRREVAEETGLQIDVGPVIEVFDPIQRDASRAIRYHYVIIDYLCRATGGELRAGSDAAEIALAEPEKLDEYALTELALRVIGRGVQMAAEIGWWRSP